MNGDQTYAACITTTVVVVSNVLKHVSVVEIRTSRITHTDTETYEVVVVVDYHEQSQRTYAAHPCFDEQGIRCIQTEVAIYLVKQQTLSTVDHKRSM